MTYTLEIESYVATSDSEARMSPNAQPQARLSKQEQRKLLFNEGNTLARANYIQSDADIPELDVEQGRFSEV